MVTHTKLPSLVKASSREGTWFGFIMAWTMASMALALVTQDLTSFVLHASLFGPLFIFMHHRSLRKWRELEELHNEFIFRAMVVSEALDIDNDPDLQKRIEDYMKDKKAEYEKAKQP